jgi:hypothetical protein
MKKNYFFIFLFILPLLATAQKQITLKKKYFGIYTGIMAGYLLDSGTEVVTVKETKMAIQISKNAITFDIGRLHFSGNYRVVFESKEYLVLDATIDGQLQSERIRIYKKGKEMRREGVYPQPETELKKN